MPVLQDMLAQLGAAKIFSSLDLLSGYCQVPLDDESKQFTAFSTHKEHLQFETYSASIDIEAPPPGGVMASKRQRPLGDDAIKALLFQFESDFEDNLEVQSEGEEEESAAIFVEEEDVDDPNQVQAVALEEE
ncbi:uncharacterized protein LOC135206348 [Macrobrachium nipponense]|uniref:uncharacterized protein LOC135206348 n=1 Tax=Macrobrachium nipponense TaxID=159736 RepID=UPI0030C8C064